MPSHVQPVATVPCRARLPPREVNQRMLLLAVEPREAEPLESRGGRWGCASLLQPVEHGRHVAVHAPIMVM